MGARSRPLTGRRDGRSAAAARQAKAHGSAAWATALAYESPSARLGQEIRQLARDLRDLCCASACMSATYSIVDHCASHLELLASRYEANK